MFTKNFKDYIKAIFLKSEPSASMTAVDGTPYTGYIWNQSIRYIGIGYLMSHPQTGSYSGLWFGTDSTPATEDDYNLGGKITSGLSFTSGSTVVGKEAEGKYVATVSHGVKNTSSTPINIYEIGLVAPCPTATSSSSPNTKYFLMERTVLSEPISLGAGEEKIITYKITFNQLQA